MPILDDSAKVYICNSNIRKYREMGYNPMSKEYLEVKIKDLPKYSMAEVSVECDYCKKRYVAKFCDVIKNTDIVDKICCIDCCTIKMREVMMVRYGEDNPSKIEAFNVKREKTCMDKYGCKYQISSQSTQNKLSKIFNAKYGVNYPLENKDIIQKVRNSCYLNNGVLYPLQSPQILDKTRETQIAKYGTMLFVHSTSKQQIYLCNLYSGILNYKIGMYCVDILLDNNIFLEYDGGGHNLSVRLGKMSQLEFEQREISRSAFLIKSGYKEFRMVCTTDKLPDDNTLMDILHRAKTILIDKNYTTYIYDADCMTESYR